MAHPLECPSCHFTTRVSDELFASKVSGRRVKISCKGCREPMVVDATTSEVHILPYRLPSPGGGERAITSTGPVAPPTAPSPQAGEPSPRLSELHGSSKGSLAPSLAPSADAWVPGPAPTERARALHEEELPTLRRNEIPLDEAFLSPVVASDPPPTTWPQTIPPLGDTESLSALLAPAPRRGRARVALVALVAIGLLSVGGWAARNHPSVSEWGAQGIPQGAPADVASREGHHDQVGRPASQAAPVPATAAHLPEPEARPALPLDALARDTDLPSAAHAPTAAPTSELAGATPLAGAAVVSPPKSPAASPSGSLAGGVTGSGIAVKPPTSGETQEHATPTALAPFDKAAASAALQVAESQAAACRSAGDPSGTTRVVVTFAPSGRVTSATVSGAPFAGTATGGCIAGRFRSAQVPPFEGNYVTVTKTVLVQ